MERDMDLIRRIAIATAELPHGEYLHGLEEVEEVAFARHVQWMEEAGLLKGGVVEYLDGGIAAHAIRLTWDGCEFVDSVRSDTLWRKAKEYVIKPSGSFTFGLLRDWLRTEIQQGLPSLRNLSQ